MVFDNLGRFESEGATVESRAEGLRARAAESRDQSNLERRETIFKSSSHNNGEVAETRALYLSQMNPEELRREREMKQGGAGAGANAPQKKKSWKPTFRKSPNAGRKLEEKYAVDEST